MKKQLHILLGLFLMLTAGINAQNLLDENAAAFDDAIGDVWKNVNKGTGALSSYSTDPTDATNNCLKMDNNDDADDGTAGQAKAQSNANATKLFSLTGGVTYKVKYKRYVTSGYSATGDKLWVIGESVKNTTFNKFDQWEEVEVDFIPASDVTGGYFKLQINPGTALIYYDDFYIAEKPYEPSVTFNITRPASDAQNVWITLEETSQLLSMKTDPVETSTIFTGLTAGTYTYYAMGRGYEFVSGEVIVAADADATVNITLTDDVDNVLGQLVFYANYSATGPEGKGNPDKAIERAAAIYSLKMDGQTIYANNGTGFWVGNVNNDMTTAGAIYTYRMDYNNSLHSTHVESAPSSLKPREGWINVDEAQSANFSSLYKYFGWFDANFIVEDESGDPIDATITIEGNDITTGANGIGVVELEDDGTTYDYTVSATGYVSATGTVTQTDTEVTRDILIPTITLVSDGSTDVQGINGGSSIYNVGSSLYLNANEGEYKIYSITGTLVQSGLVENEVNLSIPQGIYIVKVGTSAVKIKL